MSHELTVFEWVNRLTNEFNELRIAASDVVKMKAVEAAHEMGLFLNDASVFISNHQPELLSGVLSASTVVLYVYILKRALNAENKVHELTHLLSHTERRVETALDAYDEAEQRRAKWQLAWFTLDEENDKLQNQINSLNYELGDMSDSFTTMREEHSDAIAELTSERDSIQTELDEMETSRDYWQEQANDWEYDARSYESDRDEARAELDSIRSAVPQLAYVA